MSMMPLLLAAVLVVAASEGGIGEESFDPATVDVSDAINCYLDAPTYNSFALSIGTNDEISRQRGWKKIDSDNPFLLEFRLPSEIFVTDNWTTDHIAFTSTGIMAVLDLEDPNAIAGQVGVENQIGTDPLIAALVREMQAATGEQSADGTSPQESHNKPAPVLRKFLGQTVLVDEIGPPFGEDNWRQRTVISRNLSNVSSHPGKTLFGCSYKMELLDSRGERL